MTHEDMIGLTSFYDRLAALKWHRLILGDDYETLAEYTELCDVTVDIVDGDDPDGPAHRMLEDFKAYHCTGPAFGTERAPMPQRPYGQLTII